MELTDLIVLSDWVVVLASFITPVIMAPQIIRVVRLKEANAVSLLTLWGSFFLQANIFLNAFLHTQPQIMVSMTLSLVPLGILLFFVHWYRWKHFRPPP